MLEGRAEPPRPPKADGRSGRILYEALSRRAGGLSLGVNLFPDGKRCSFDCAYCEVFPGPPSPPFSLAELETELEAWVLRAEAESKRPLDIAFAGDGEPSLSPALAPALELAAAARRRWPGLLGSAKLVLITNSTGFLEPGVAELLHRLVADEGLQIWAKLDAGTEAWYRRIDRRGPPFASLVEGLLAFSRRSPVLLQTMVCALAEGRGEEALAPPPEEFGAWAALLLSLLAEGARISEIQLYTQSRPSPEGLCAPLGDEALLSLAAGLRERAAGRCLPPLRVFGALGELDFPGGSS